MRLLADENVDGPLVAWLRGQGEDVVWVAESQPGLADAEVLALAARERRVLLTQDRDFGELVFRGAGPGLPAGLVYVRIRSTSAAELVRWFARRWAVAAGRAVGNFVVVTRGRVRIRPLAGR